ncbi:MAG: LssY C-terminal domain-containing protein [Acidobacteriaceae bacterium]|nr:LssY C-terminal domain-containing protein [Acidobacteriaceae bacterium]
MSLNLQAQTAPPKATSLTVAIAPGHSDGKVVATVDGKPHTVTAHGRLGWLAEAGESALVVTPAGSKGEQGPQLRLYDIDTGERHTLGALPMMAPAFKEAHDEHGLPVFFLTGEQDGKPTIYIADAQAIRAVLTGASNPTVDGQTLHVRNSNGSEQTYTLAEVTGAPLLNRIYKVGPRTLQLLPTGTAYLQPVSTEATKVTWTLDSENVVLHEGEKTETISRASLQTTEGIPADTRLTVRLLAPLNSRTAKVGQSIQAVLITPAMIGGKLYLPQGTTIDGTIVEAHGVHYGMGHERAALALHFTTAKPPAAASMPIDAYIVAVDNANESVDSKGVIHGVRATGTLGHSAEGKIVALAQVDPIAYIALQASGTAVLGFAESEILYPAGTEMIMRFAAPVITETTFTPSIPLTVSADQAGLAAMVKSLPYRTATQTGNHPSDLTNLVFLGTPAEVARAFTSAGWVKADTLTAASTFSTMRSVSGTEVYREAPMSMLLLNGKEPLYTFTKTTNTFNSRHHLRIFDTGLRYEGVPVLTASSTQDTGIAFSRKKRTLIHVIDHYIDNERSKVVNDLVFTHCVDGLQMVERPWVPLDAYNSTGDRLRTDGETAVLQMNGCEQPHITFPTPAVRPNLFERSIRNTMLTLRNDIYRGNVVYQGVDGGIKVRGFLHEKDAPRSLGSWYRTEASEADPSLAYGEPQDHREAKEVLQRETTMTAAQRWAPPHYEIALHGGYIRFRNASLESDLIALVPDDPANPTYVAGFGDEVGDGWTAGFTVTLNSWKWVSNEFGYFRQQGKYRLNGISIAVPGNDTNVDDAVIDEASETVGLVTRQFEYNTLIHFRPPTSRWRPYIAAGPVLQLIALSDAPLKKPAGVYTLGLKNIGLFKAAFDFGNTPPLDGGGIFQPGLEYGAGIKYRVTPRIMVRMDWRETWSKNPQIIRDSYEEAIPDDLQGDYDALIFHESPDKKFFQQRATMGIAFTF